MSRSSLKTRLQASSILAGLLAAWAGAVHAQTTGASSGPDAAGEERIVFEADAVYRDTEDGPIIAEGDVRAYFGERFLRAQKISYDPATDIVVAEGDVSITDADLETAFAGRVLLSGDLRDAVAENFSALLAENSRLAAESAVREQGARTRLSNAVYTACSVCNDEGEPKTPTWRVKALRVTRDEERKVVRFHHAFFEIKGVPVLYAPFLQAPDPTVERQSGFLTPLIGASSRLGFNFELPYYLAISNSMDATFFPKYTSRDGVLWQGEFRRRGDRGYHVFSGGVIDFDNSSPDENGNLPVDVPGVRWNVFAKGNREFGETWRAGYDIERVSDDTYLRRYDVRRRGDLRQEIDTSEANRLRSNIFVRRETDDSTLSIDAFAFQGLRSQDRADLTPYVLPLIDYERRFDGLAGGQGTVNFNFAALQRTGGVDTRRVTASAFWEREHITRNGHRLRGFAELRADGFAYADLDEGNENTLGAPLSTDAVSDPTDFDARFAPSVGLEWSYPLTRRLGAARLFVEPRALLVASPSGRNDLSILNEDSQSVEFDYPSIFEYNKATGFDAFEDGQRLNAGLAAAAVFDNGLTIEGEAGAQFRLQKTDAFTPQNAGAAQFPTGLGEERSDIVGALNIKYRNVLGLENRFRIDDDTGSFQRVESMAYLNLWKLRSNLSYVQLEEENLQAEITRREELNGTLNFQATKRWYGGLGWREDLLAGRTIRQDFIIGYQDDCALFEVTYRRDRTRDEGLPADNAFLVRFTLRSLAE